MVDSDRQCTATAKSTGERCQRAAIKGGNVCPVHGGSANQVEKKAQERLDEMANSATAKMQSRLDEIFTRLDGAEGGDYVKLLREARQLTTDILDRTDHGPTEKREVTGEDGGPLEINMSETVVETDYDNE